MSYLPLQPLAVFQTASSNKFEEDHLIDSSQQIYDKEYYLYNNVYGRDIYTYLVITLFCTRLSILQASAKA